MPDNVLIRPCARALKVSQLGIERVLGYLKLSQNLMDNYKTPPSAEMAGIFPRIEAGAADKIFLYL